MGRQKKNELDAILEQLKKSYATDVDNELEDSLLETEKSEEDAELAAVLEKIFVSGSEENKDDNNSESIVADQSIDEDIKMSDDEMVLPETNKEISQEIADVIEDASVREDNSQEEKKVDDILSVMLHCDLEESVTEVGKDEITDDNMHIEEQFDDVCINVETAEEIVEGQVSEDNQSTCDNEIDSTPTFILNYSSDEEYGEIYEGVNVKDELVSDAMNIEAGPDESPALFEDIENIDIIEEQASLMEETVEEDFSADDVNECENEPIASPKKIVLDPDEYTKDMLQHSISDLLLFKPEDDIDASVLIETHTDENEETAQEDIHPIVPARETNDSDVSLLMKFGYGEEIVSSVGNEYARAVVIEKNNKFIPEKQRIAHGFTGKEFSSDAQISGISQKYRFDKMSLLISSLVISIIAVVMLVVDFLAVHSVTPDDYLSIIIFEMILTVAISAIIYKKLYSGILGISRFEANTYSMLSIIIIEYLLYCMIMSIIHAAAPNNSLFDVYLAFGGYVSFYAAFVSWAEYLDCYRESNTFNMVCNGETHCALEKTIETSGQSTKRQTCSYNIKKTKYVSGYFKRTVNYKTSGIRMVLVAGVIPFIAIIFCVVISSIRDSFVLGVNAAACILFAAVPIPTILIPSIAEFIHSINLSRSGSAFIGKDSVKEYSELSSITISDNDAIEITSLTEINPNKKDQSSKKWFNMACNVFGALGGPLSDAINFRRTDQSNVSHDVNINSISENGIDLYFDSSVNVLVGDRQYMLTHNIKVKTDTHLSTAVKGADKTVVYLAFDGVPRIAFIVASKVKRSFLEIVELLNSNKIKIIVNSYEPEINEYYFESNKIENSVAVQKPDIYEHSEPSEICDSGIVAKTPLHLCNAVVYAKQIVKDRKDIKLYQILQTIFGFGVAGLTLLAFCKAPDSAFMEFIQTNALLIFYITSLIGTIPGITRIIKLFLRIKK